MHADPFTGQRVRESNGHPQGMAGTRDWRTEAQSHRGMLKPSFLMKLHQGAVSPRDWLWKRRPDKMVLRK